MGVNRKKMFEVLPLKTRLMGIGVNGRMLKFGKKTNCFVTHDAGLAQDIEQMYGKEGTRDVTVIEVDNGQGLTPRKVFTVQAPWKRYEK